jgi:hypothetical protein
MDAAGLLSSVRTSSIRRIRSRIVPTSGDFAFTAASRACFAASAKPPRRIADSSTSGSTAATSLCTPLESVDA